MALLSQASGKDEAVSLSDTEEENLKESDIFENTKEDTTPGILEEIDEYGKHVESLKEDNSEEHFTDCSRPIEVTKRSIKNYELISTTKRNVNGVNQSMKRPIEAMLNEDTDSHSAKRIAKPSNAADDEVILLDSDDSDADGEKSSKMSNLSASEVAILEDTSSTASTVIVEENEKLVQLLTENSNIEVNNEECNESSFASNNKDENSKFESDKVLTASIENKDSGDDPITTLTTYRTKPTRLSDSKKICCNENCQNLSSQHLVRAPSHALSFFCLHKSKQNRKRICQDCLTKANAFQENCVSALRSETAIFTYKVEPKPVLTIQLYEDSDQEDSEDLKYNSKMSEVVQVSNLESILEAMVIHCKLSLQTKQCEKILENEIDDLTKQFEEIDSSFDKTKEILESTRKMYLDVLDPKVRPILIAEVDIDDGDHIKESPQEVVPKKCRQIAIKKTALPPKISELNSSHPRSSLTQTTEDFNEVREVDLVRKTVPQIQVAPSVLPRVEPKIGDRVYGMHKTLLHYWLQGEVIAIHTVHDEKEYVVKFEHVRKGRIMRDCKEGSSKNEKSISAKHLAYNVACPFVLPVGTRIIAKFKDLLQVEPEGHGHYYAGIVAEPPKNANHFRYLIFFDDGYAQYVSQDEVLLICEASKEVWLDIHPSTSDFMKNYLSKYPERPMVRCQKGSVMSTELRGEWLSARVAEVDCSLVKMHFEVKSLFEWIYRGSTRLLPLYQKQERQLTSGIKSNTRRHDASTASQNANQPTIEYLYGDEDIKKKIAAKGPVAKKSTSSAPVPQGRPMLVGVVKETGPLSAADNQLIEFEGSLRRRSILSNVPRPKEYTPHTCDGLCVMPYNKDDRSFRALNPLVLPMYLGWAREITKGSRRRIFYRAPCGRRLRDYSEVHSFLKKTNCELGIDYFCFDFPVDCFHEFSPTRIITQLKDLTYNRDLVKITCVNALGYDNPDYLDYAPKRILGKGVTIDESEDFLICCDCIDDCMDNSNCACRKLTQSEIPPSRLNTSVTGYENKRLYGQITSGIYECNNRCSCKSTCFNRVVQQPQKWHLQVFKTTLKGWGVRPLFDIPRGAFMCTYSGVLLTEEGANEDGRTFGDEYLAELDFIEINDQVKADYEENVTDIEDDCKNTSDLVKTKVVTTSRGRVVTTKSVTNHYDSDDDEGGRKGNPSKFDAKLNSISKRQKPQRIPTRELFGKNEQCYVIDAKSKGNVGRYLNHSCEPNLFVQNVFVDTHDIRFPLVSFFALKHIRAGTELTWNYNYDIGSVPGKSMYCYCGATQCRGRLL